MIFNIVFHIVEVDLDLSKRWICFGKIPDKSIGCCLSYLILNPAFALIIISRSHFREGRKSSFPGLQLLSGKSCISIYFHCTKNKIRTLDHDVHGCPACLGMIRCAKPVLNSGPSHMPLFSDIILESFTALILKCNPTFICFIVYCLSPCLSVSCMRAGTIVYLLARGHYWIN